MEIYKSPIQLVMGEMRTEYENKTMKVIQSYGIDVDKEELTKALNYDRQQWEEGYKAAVHNILEKCKELEAEHCAEYGAPIIEAYADAFGELEDILRGGKI